MDINMTVWSSTPSIINNNLRFTFAESEAPQTIVRNELNTDVPHSFPMAVSYGGFNPVAHIVRIYTTPDASLGTLLSEFLYDPTWTNIEVRMPLEIPVDTADPYSPAEGTTTLVVDGSQGGIPTIQGWDWTPKMRTRAGQLSVSEYTRIDPNSEGGSGVGFEFPEGFYAPDFIFIEFAPKITVSSPTFNYLKLFAGINVISGNTTVDDTHYNVLNEIISLNNVVTITFPSFVSIPANTLLRYTTMMGAQGQVRFVAESGEFFKWGNANLPAIFLGKCEVFEVLRGTDGWHVTQDLPGMRMVGLPVSADTGLLQSCINPNILPADGGSMNAADWPRVLWYCQQLPGGMFIPIGSRNEDNCGLWAYTEVSGDITLLHRPDRRGFHFRNIPGTSGRDSGRTNTTQAGTTDGSYLMDHAHFTVVDDGYNTSGFAPLVDAVKSMVKWWSKTSGSGKESTWLAAVNHPSNPQPTLSPTSIAGKRRTPEVALDENTVKTTGIVSGIFV